MREDEAKAPKQRSKPTQNQNIQKSEPEAHETKTAANTAFLKLIMTLIRM
ncbi:hypothetical protein PMSV_526 [Photobacterium leiognathi subsp. mandapamensis svers.1.1.]|nr:hypothetical protein PMSV_526 [Photobacterium leiognathi subsp. mandapamensis svers.1.1.]